MAGKFKYVQRYADNLGGVGEFSIEERDLLEERDLQLEHYLATSPQLIEKRVLTVASADEAFSIPPWCSSATLKWSGQSSAGTDVLRDVLTQFNGVGGTNYHWQKLDDGASTQALSTDRILLGNLNGAVAAHHSWGLVEFFDLQGGAGSARLVAHTGYITAGDIHNVQASGLFLLSDPITTVRINVTGAGATKFAVGGAFWLYGSP